MTEVIELGIFKSKKEKERGGRFILVKLIKGSEQNFLMSLYLVY